jgi:uncharacterized membrane protein
MGLGAAMLAVGIAKRKTYPGMAAAVLGTAMVLRGAQGYKRLYKLVGKELPGKPVHLARRAVRVQEEIVIDRTPEELYTFWRNFENLPSVMGHLLSVQDAGNNRSHWVAKAPAGTVVEWDAQILDDAPNHFISWRSLEGSDVDNEGFVRFAANPGGGTRVTVAVRYTPPADVLGAKVAKLLGADPAKEIAEDLKRLKQKLEVQSLI